MGEGFDLFILCFMFSIFVVVVVVVVVIKGIGI